MTFQLTFNRTDKGVGPMKAGFTARTAGLLGVCAFIACTSEPRRVSQLDVSLDPAFELPDDQSVGVSNLQSDTRVREVALRFVEQVLRRDGRALTASLAPRLARAIPRPTPVHLEREQVLPLLLRVGQTTTAREAIEQSGIVVSRVATEVTPTPAGLLPTDYVVTFSLTQRGRETLRFLIPGWFAQGRILVRMDNPPVIVGF